MCSTEDLRTVKTKKALYETILLLLKKHSFKKVTVKEVCEEASISRAAFYAHFIDKYDLLKQWMRESWTKNFSNCDSYEKLEQAINNNMKDKRRILKNLIYDADNETFMILFNVILSVKKLTVDKNSKNEILHRDIALSNFYAGGIISYLIWQVANNFPVNVPLMNREVYQILEDFQDKQLR